MPGPLTGIRVLEFANFISGPYASMLLADLGADVTKVEMLETGDPFRKWGGHKGGARPQFSAYNRGKQSLALNIQTAEGRDVFRRLAARADVVIENFRPGTVDRLGIGYDDLRADNPGLVYCGISGMGQTGPYARRPSYDSIGLAMSGLWSRFVDLDRPRPIGPNLADQLTSLFAVYGILGALVYREKHGVGQRVDASLLVSNFAFLPEPIANYFSIGEIGNTETRARRSQSYAMLAADGLPLTVHLSSVPKFWEGLARTIERPELLDDARFTTNSDRIKNYDVLRSLLDDVFKTRTRDEWLARLEAEDVPSAPIYSIAEAIADPQIEHLGAIREYGDGERAVRLVGTAVTYSQTPACAELPPPQVGEHSDDILHALGYSDAEIASLRAAGAV